MDYKQKILLLKDLCARLPYGVKYCRESWNYEWDQEMSVVEVLEDIDKEGYINYHKVYKVWDIKPYLRPLSSMTEKEKKEFNDTFNGFFQYFNHGIISASRVWDENEAVFVGELSCSRLIDWLNEHHFDYRKTPDGKTMIEAGLALEATEDMYKTE